MCPDNDSRQVIVQLEELAQRITALRLSEDERRKYQDELLECQVLSEGLFEYAPDAIVVIDAQGGITRLNKRAERLFGYTRSELTGKHYTDLVPERYREEYAGRMQAYMVEPSIQDLGGALELYAIKKDGAEFPIALALGPLETVSETLFLCIVRDVSERKMLESTCAESEERYRSLVELSPDAIAIHRDGKVLFCNAAGARLLRLPSAEALIGMNIADIVHPDYHHVMARRIEEVRAGQVVPFVEEKFVRADGSLLDVEVISTGFTYHGHPAVQSIVRDITARKAAEQRLTRTMQELAGSNQELEQFAYAASHDLQEPLRMITSFTQLLEKRYKDKLGSDADEFIGYIVDGASRMQAMISDLLDYSRVGTRGRPFRPTDCERVLEQALANLKMAIDESGAVVTHDPLPVLTADETQLVQLLQNLIGNAVKFRSREPPRVHVSAREEQDEWLLTVRDNGIGIEPQFHEQIFHIFQRLHSGQKYPGTGIGLAIAKRIVERHGGRIWVESEPGKGSTFRFTISKARRGGK